LDINPFLRASRTPPNRYRQREEQSEYALLTLAPNRGQQGQKLSRFIFDLPAGRMFKDKSDSIPGLVNDFLDLQVVLPGTMGLLFLIALLNRPNAILIHKIY
jgi:hypothetical protein